MNEMKRSVLKNVFTKNLLLIATGVFLVCFNVSAQLSLYGLNANFGVDADSRAGSTKYGTAPSPNYGDDWFSFAGGRGVIDTSNTSFYKSQLQSNRNISFRKYMSAPLFAGIDNKLWLDGIYLRDYTSADGKDSTAYGNAAKNGMSPASWSGRPESIPNKTDIVDTYAHFRRNGLNINDSLWLFTGVSTVGTNGDRYFDIELYKKRVSYDMNSGTFTTDGLSGGRTEWLFDPFGNILQTGDLIISVCYKSGQAPVIDVRIWVSRLTYQVITPRLFNFSNNYDGGILFGYASIVSKTNTTAFGSGGGNFANSASTDTTYSTPWGSVNTSGNWSPNYNQLQFVEIGLNLTRMGIDPALYNSLNACDRIFHTVFFKSRSSNSFTANLQDFAGPAQLSSPVLDFTANTGDTLTCTNPVGQLTINNPSSVGVFNWTTLTGNITGSNQDSTVIQVDKKGTYILTARLAAGCVANRIQIFQVLEDKLPPIATADITMTPAGNIQLLGGDSLASTLLAPFGGSKGLVWEWKGPNGFTSNEQNPILDIQWIWGAYYLTLKELRNGCVDHASLDVSFSAHYGEASTANFGEASFETINGAETMTLRKAGMNLYLTANQKESFQGLVAFYSTTGQLLGKQNINLNKGFSNIELKLAAANQIRVVAVYKGGQLVYTRKINH